MTVRDMTLALYKSVDNLQIHLTALCEWYVRVEKDGRRREFTAESIEQVLKEALDYKWLPLVPRKPLRYEYIVKKGTGGQYNVLCNGLLMLKTSRKSEAEQYVNHYLTQGEKALKEWEEKYAWTIGKAEGVDFEYKWR